MKEASRDHLQCLTKSGRTNWSRSVTVPNEVVVVDFDGCIGLSPKNSPVVAEQPDVETHESFSQRVVLGGHHPTAAEKTKHERVECYEHGGYIGVKTGRSVMKREHCCAGFILVFSMGEPIVLGLVWGIQVSWS